MYTIGAVRQILGWARPAVDRARERGLAVRYTAGRGFIFGQDLVDYIRDHGKTELRPRRTKRTETAAAAAK
jgi:hypothetical protein